MHIKRIGTKLLLYFLVFVVLLLLLGAFSIYSISQVNNNGQDMYDHRLLPAIDLLYISEKSGNIRLQMVQALLRKDVSLTEQALTDLEEVDSFIESYSKYIFSEEEKERFESFRKKWEIFDKRVRNNASLMRDGNFEKADEGIRLGRDEYNAAYANLQELIEVNKNLSKELIDDSNKIYKNILTILITIIIVATIIAVTISAIAGNKISNSIKMVLSRVSQIAEGDLTGEKISVKSKDEIAQLAEGVNIMQNNLYALVDSTAQVSEHVSSSAEELSASAEQSTTASEQLANLSESTSEGADKQLQSINEISSSIEQLSASIQQIAVSSTDMLSMSEKANESTLDGSETVRNVVQQMNVISDIVGQLSKIISNLDLKTQEIGKVTDIITDISEQTSLLALNAAIEAARAGEHGQGFAVVADEVRKLAEKSKQSASLISETLNEVRTETSQAVTYMNDGTEKVQQGMIFADEITNSFTNIQELISSVSSKVQEVSASIQEMTSVSEHIVKNSEQVQQIAETTVLASQESSAATEEQLATIEEISSSAQSLSSLAEDLRMMISKFKV